MKWVYIAGPMRGYDDLNFPAFNKAAEMWNYKSGWMAVNPVDLNPDPDADYIECMRIDIRALTACDAIYLLKGWHASEGANAEYQIARMLNLEIYFEEPGLDQA